MIKITFMGAGSTGFARRVLGDCFLSPILRGAEVALYDINEQRLEESFYFISSINQTINEGRATIKKYLGVESRKAALKDATFVVNAIQVGGYEPSTVIDFEIPKKYGLLQTIGDTLGVGGIFRGLRTISVMEGFARDMEEVCPNALLLNYTNPMAMVAGYMQRYTNVRTIGLCHSVQVCSRVLLEELDMKVDGFIDYIAGINHMAWLLKITDLEGNDLYPEIKKRALLKNANEKHNDMVRFEYIKHLGYYCTESSEHNSEYNPFFIKRKYPQLIDEFKIPLDEYPRRCVNQIEEWKQMKEQIQKGETIGHTRSEEYASFIMEAVVTNTPYQINANVLNRNSITNLPANACVEVPCLVNANGVMPTIVGELPPQLAAMNRTNINPQLLTIEAAYTKKKEHIYHALMLDPHTSAELSIDDIVKMADEMMEAHAKSGFPVLS